MRLCYYCSVFAYGEKIGSRGNFMLESGKGINMYVNASVRRTLATAELLELA